MPRTSTQSHNRDRIGTLLMVSVLAAYAALFIAAILTA